MTTAAGSVAVGPEQGRICIRTTRQGMAAKVGHDLEIQFDAWSAQLSPPDGDPAAASVSVRIELDSLRVVSGTGGVTALTADDRKEIAATALKVLDAQRHPIAEFHSQQITRNGADGEVRGTLELAGNSAPVTLQVTATGPQAWRATGAIAQTALGIKPYKAFLGALRLSDEVGIEAEINLAKR
jgi:polyisoprenoid-binding protein YceI